MGFRNISIHIQVKLSFIYKSHPAYLDNKSLPQHLIKCMFVSKLFIFLGTFSFPDVSYQSNWYNFVVGLLNNYGVI